MKMSIRPQTFETNSSSVHAFVSMSETTYDYWRENGVLMLEDALEAANEKGVDYRFEDSPASGDEYVVSKEIYEKYSLGMGGGDAFTYQNAQALNSDSEYEADSYVEHKFYGDIKLEFDYFG